MPVELLAPAGQPDAGYAALHYGADAIYLGLNQLSARAEAVNFSPDQLFEIVAYAHSLTPGRKVYLALNTLVQQHELDLVVTALTIASEAGIDAVIVQDLGVAKTVKEYFPHLALHASTQMAIHNLEGVRAAQQLGFTRVTLARELTLQELRHIIKHSEVEIEAFIHGTLCYSYSGLCLFSSVTCGRSGNRGRCIYSCREAMNSHQGQVHPFSLKDMALGPRVLDLVALGIHSLKIEGRKKSPLYVAATVAYYRKILDGKLAPSHAPAAEAQLQTIFARPWTRLFLDSRHNPKAADIHIVGHRGARVGTLDKVVPTPAGLGVQFRSTLAIECRDGIQIDIPGSPRPYGMPVDNLYLAAGKQLTPAFTASPGTTIVVALPKNSPPMSPGLPVYLASSQEVKQSYPFDKPKPGAFSEKVALDVDITLIPAADTGNTCTITVKARTPSLPFSLDPSNAITAELTLQASGFPARDLTATAIAVRAAFDRTKDSRFYTKEIVLSNPLNLYVRPGEWNTLRRDLLETLESAYQRHREQFLAKVTQQLQPPKTTPASDLSWSVFVERCTQLDEFTQADFANLTEIVVSATSNTPQELEHLATTVGHDRIRLALPLILREHTLTDIRHSIATLRDMGWNKWLVSNPAAFSLLDMATADVTADWPLYTVNTQAAKQLLALGCRAFTVSLEDDAKNYRSLLASYPNNAWVTVYSALPLLIAAACAHAHLGRCRDLSNPEKCRYQQEATILTMEKSGDVEVYSQGCGSIIAAKTPFSLAGSLNKLKDMGARNLRVDFRWKNISALQTVEIWRHVPNGTITGSSDANFYRGLT